MSKGTLHRSLAVLEADLRIRITEGFWARVKRYFSDAELRKRLILAEAAQREANR